MPLPPALRALRHRDFRLFWTGQLVSLVGTWMQNVGQSWLILQLTDSPFQIGLITTLQFLPMLTLSVFAGAWVDRLPKRRLILGTQTALMVQAFILAALTWTGAVRYWHVAVLATCLGLVNTLDVPARQSFVVEMVGKDDLINAVALNSAVFNGARMVGPAVAGLLVGWWGPAPAFFLNGLSFLAVLAALTRVRAQGLPRDRERASIGQEVAEGLAYVFRTPTVLFPLVLLLAVSLFVINYSVTVPLLAQKVLGLDAKGLGFLMASLGAGSLAGALVLAAVGRGRPPVAVLVATGGAVSLGCLFLGFVAHQGAAAAILFAMGFAQILFTSLTNTTLQVTAPDAVRGRVMSLYSLVFGGITPVGAFLCGTVAEWYGVPAMFRLTGALSTASVVALALWWARLVHRPAPGPAAGEGGR